MRRLREPAAQLGPIDAALRHEYGDSGAQAADLLARWVSGDVRFAEPEIVSRHLDPELLPLTFDAFRQILPFGTGGRRGPVGYGPNRVNRATVALTVRGHCEYLRERFGDREEIAVVVANDVREFNDLAGTYRFLGDSHPLLGVSSRSLAEFACEIYAWHGVVAYLKGADQEAADSDRTLLTTPELSFLIIELGAAGGVNFSASHNPPDDNGLKIYDERGAQPVPPFDQELADKMDRLVVVDRKPLGDARSANLVRPIPDGLHERYVDLYESLYGRLHQPGGGRGIVYTPLCGCGLTTVADVAKRIGFEFQVPPDHGPNGRFDPIPFRAPNPEVPQATSSAKAYADEVGATLVLSSDPDADRVGVDALVGDGAWRHLTGNQIAAVLAYFLMLDPRGPQRRGLLIETLVTTRLLGEIAERAGTPIVDDLLVGFKYVADVLEELAETGRSRGVEASPDDLVLAAEESHGVSVTARIRDKDATPAAVFLAALHEMLEPDGETLFDYYLKILDELGGFGEMARSIVMLGARGVEARTRIMDSLRREPPEDVGGLPVESIRDHWGARDFVSETDRMSRDVLEIRLEGAVVTVRPSGTEPKVKLYCQVLPDPTDSGLAGLALYERVMERCQAVATATYADLLGRIDVSLTRAALLLPDIVPLDRKQEFDREIVPRLRERLEADAGSLEALLQWLRDAAAHMTPGSDPLPGLKDPIAALCAEWRDELAQSALLARLDAWARG